MNVRQCGWRILDVVCDNVVFRPSQRKLEMWIRGGGLWNFCKVFLGNCLHNETKLLTLPKYLSELEKNDENYVYCPFTSFASSQNPMAGCCSKVCVNMA